MKIQKSDTPFQPITIVLENSIEALIMYYQLQWNAAALRELRNHHPDLDHDKVSFVSQGLFSQYQKVLNLSTSSK